MPEFRHLMANLIAEVVSRYDVDGINLDYVRAIGLCTSDFCQADYQKRSAEISFWILPNSN